MKIISIGVAVISGIIVLLGYFFPSNGLQNIRQFLLDWVVTLAGVAGLLAILNLVFRVHWKRIREGGNRKGYSFVVILSFMITVAVGIFLGPSSQGFRKVVTAIEVPIESSLMAVLAFTLAISSLKILSRQHNWMGLLFLISVVIFLVLNSGVFSFVSNIPVLKDILSAFHQIPSAGARGILLGIALGSLVTGIRVLTGSDHPYNG